MTTLLSSTRSLAAALLVVAAASTVQAQISTGSISGVITDEQGGALPGVTVQATHTDTGFVRVDVSDGSGTFRLAALPVGSYDISAELQGFRRFQRTGVVVNISRTAALDLVLGVAGVTETVTVTTGVDTIGRASTRSSSVGEIVNLDRIQGLPLNGRQFANLAATVPGVSLGFNSEATKSTQYTPQISGGNGRNINYIVDGGDNNDDTVGGLSQLFPLEAIQEFDVMTQRFDAEYGRSNGAVLNVVTKSGTNELRTSWFTLMRDDALNARTLTETKNNVEKQAYRRYQFGGSFGGPLVQNKAHYFAAYERTQQDTKQVVNTLGLFPAGDGIFDVPFRQDLFTGKLTVTPRAQQYLTVRYGRDRNSQPSGASPLSATSHTAWATSTNTFDSINANHNWVVGPSLLNEMVVQFSNFTNDLPLDTTGPSYAFASVFGGAHLAAPQRTEERKWQLRNDVSWTTDRLAGLAHEFKVGVNWVHVPHLSVFTGQASEGFFALSANSLTAPVVRAIVVGNNPEGNLPYDMFGVYAQDTWRVTNRMTLNLGVRWDYVDGMPIDQRGSPNFQAMQQAGRNGRFAGTILDEFGNDPTLDLDNIQPRLGVVYDLRGDGRDIIRGGWGIYTDFGYVNSNALVSALDASGGGLVFSATSNTGLRKADGTLFQISDPLTAIAHLNTIPAGSVGVAGEVTSPLLEQPYSRQANVGWAHLLGDSTTLSADYVRVDGRELNLRIRPNVLVNGRRNLSDLAIFPQDNNFRVALSKGSSQYDALILALRRPLSSRLDVSASYTLAKATSNVGTASDELNQNNIQSIQDPFGAVQQGPSSRTDARHTISLSAIVQAPWDISIAPIFYYRTALPVHTFEGVDFNADGNNVDITPLAYRYTGLSDTGVATFEEAGACKTVNCSRRAPFSQLNLRASKSFRLAGTVRLDAIAEVFNLFDAKNPFIPLTQRRLSGGAQLPSFMQPNAYAGDANQPEQRVGQLGFRLSF